MKKERKINKIPVVAISTFGHCGIDWLHSLIDSHKEVLILPPLSFFRKIDSLKKKFFYLENTLKPNTIVNKLKFIKIKKAQKHKAKAYSKASFMDIFSDAIGLFFVLSTF